MRWGWCLGGLFGLAIGARLGPGLGLFFLFLGMWVGRYFDRGLDHPSTQNATDAYASNERVQSVFFQTTFLVMGHLAKADGRVSEEEIAVARTVMARLGLSGSMRLQAMDFFTQGKATGFDLQATLSEFSMVCHRHSDILQLFLEIQIEAAYASGDVSEHEHNILRRISHLLGFSERELAYLQSMFCAARAQHAGKPNAQQRVEQAYAVLGVDRNASDQDVKKAYRRLISQHHPDKLVSKGLPPDMMKIAADKTHEIKSAFDIIRAERGIR